MKGSSIVSKANEKGIKKRTKIELSRNKTLIFSRCASPQTPRALRALRARRPGEMAMLLLSILALWLAPSTAFVRPLPLLVPGTVRYSTPRTVVARAAPLRATVSFRPWCFYAERSKAVAERAGADGASWVGAVGLSVVGVCLLVSSVFRTVFTTVPLGSALPLLEPWLDTSTPDPDTTPTLPRHSPDTTPTP
eukprot:scaffold838_cov64-Phaeocystis_antarctica.AAC.1